MAATGTGQFTKMISDLDGFTFAEMPQEYEKELDKEEAESDEPEEKIPVKASHKGNRTALHMPSLGNNHALAQTGSTLTYGRDKHGMYKNHDHYTQLRNKINEQENEHQDLFQTVMHKLQDRTFLEQEMQMTTMNPTASITPSSESPNGMSDADTQCVVDRYAGFFAGRDTSPSAVRAVEESEEVQKYGPLKTCAQNITDYQAQHLLWDYPDLQQKFGGKG